MKREDEQAYLEEAIRRDNQAFKREEAEYKSLWSISLERGLITSEDVAKLEAEALYT